MASAGAPTVTDRELVFELITVETEVIQQLDAFEHTLTEVEIIGEHEFATLWKELNAIQKRLESGDFAKLMTAVSDRIDDEATEAYWESPEGWTWQAAHETEDEARAYGRLCDEARTLGIPVSLDDPRAPNSVDALRAAVEAGSLNE